MVVVVEVTDGCAVVVLFRVGQGLLRMTSVVRNVLFILVVRVVTLVS